LVYFRHVIGWVGCLVILSLLLWKVIPDGETWLPYIYYLVISTSFIAIPHEPMLFYYGKLYGPYLATFFAIIPTVTGCYIDYLILSSILNHKRLDSIKDNIIYKKALKYFNKFPFITILVAAFSPVPFYPIRLLSISSKYSANRYASAVLIGRIPRYLILALGGKILKIEDEYIILIFVITFIWYISVKINKKIRES